MAINKRISNLNPRGIAASYDIFPIVNVGLTETQKIRLIDIMASPGPIGGLNPNTGIFSALTLGGNAVNEFSVDGTLSGNSDLAVPTEKAVKSYVDTAVNNAVKLNVRHIFSDATAEIGDAILVDTTSGNVNIVLNPKKEGKITIKKITSDSNKVILSTITGLIDGQPTNSDLDFLNKNISLLCDGVDFYII